MDPILLDIFIIAVNIHVHGHLELHFNNVHHSNMYMGSHSNALHNTDIKLHQPPMEDN